MTYRAADSAEDNGISVLCGIERLVGKRVVVRVY